MGATGYIGSAVLRALSATDHEVLALVRTQKAADALRTNGVTPFLGDMRDQDLVTDLAAQVDAVIHTAATNDENSAAADKDLPNAVLAGLGNRGATFIRTGGIWVHGSGHVTEDTPRHAPTIVAWRDEVDSASLAAPGVRSILIEPGIVYGYGHGIPNIITRADTTSDDNPALIVPGDGDQRWGTIHVDDLADLYLLALDKAKDGSVYLGVNGHNPTVHELAQAAARQRGLDGHVPPEGTAATLERLGAVGEALLLDQQATGNRARTELNWTPTRPTLIAEVENGSYTD